MPAHAPILLALALAVGATSALPAAAGAPFVPSAATSVPSMPSAAASAPPAPRIATITIPGDPRFVAIARDVLLVQTALSPDFSAQSGLIDDAIRVPSFAPARVAELTRRLHADRAALRALPWRRWSTDEQIDVRWVYANVQRLDRELNVERLYLHRPGAWLETLANNYIAILTYAPGRTDALAGITAQVPAMVAEMARLCRPTGTDARVALGLLDGIVAALEAKPVPGADAAIAALAGYRPRLETVQGETSFAVIGATNYAWRLRHAELLPWSPAQLLALAQGELRDVDGEIATLAPQLPPPAPLPAALEDAAVHLDQAALLVLYDAIQADYRATIASAGFVTIPTGTGAIRARVTPDAMVPLTGDGGSMNPPPPFIGDPTGWWNVEHFDPAQPLAEREEIVRRAAQFRQNGMGPYAAHEGMPGHFLQLSVARLNADPLRSLFQDAVQNEGWALYAEQEMWEQGGLGRSVAAHHSMLQGWRFRIRRVVYDVNVETGAWTLQQAADYRAQAAAGSVRPDAEILRAINWPAQLICYFAGKEQILALKADYRRKMGAAYSERRFNDELLALGSVPYVFARARMLGEPVPGFDL